LEEKKVGRKSSRREKELEMRGEGWDFGETNNYSI